MRYVLVACQDTAHPTRLSSTIARNRRTGIPEQFLVPWQGGKMFAPTIMQESAEGSTAIQPESFTAPVVDCLVHRLCCLREASTRLDCYAAAQRHARGKLTIQE